MNSSLRVPLLILALGFVFISELAAAGANVDRRVDVLIHLVGLSARQEDQARVIFSQENDALQQFPTIEDRLQKGAPIRQKSRADIRALLTPAQQKIYDRTPQRLGGGATQDPAAITARVDNVVALTDEQMKQVATLYLKQVDALAGLSPEERAGKRASEISAATKTQVRALLTPEQQRKFDANPNGATDLDLRAYIVAYIKSAPAIANQLGPVGRVTPVGATSLQNELGQAFSGTYSYRVQGSTKTAVLKVSWENSSPVAPVDIVKIENEAGEKIPL